MLRLATILSLTLAAFLAAGQRSADAGIITTVTMDLSFEFSGATPPAGSSPWVRATFVSDSDVSNVVTFTLSAVNLVGVEKLTGFYFNITPAFTSANTTIAYVSGDVGTFKTISQNTYKADGDGRYDLLVEFPTSGNTFGTGDMSVYTISSTGLVANDFIHLSNPDGGKGPFYAAAHVQGIGSAGSQSGWIAPTGYDIDIEIPDLEVETPEPASITLLGIGCLGVLGAARRRRKLSVQD